MVQVLYLQIMVNSLLHKQKKKALIDKAFFDFYKEI